MRQMIHFDFTLDDADAELLFDCIHEAMCRYQERKVSSMAKGESAEVLEAFDAYIKQLQELKNKIKNQRVVSGHRLDFRVFSSIG